MMRDVYLTTRRALKELNTNGRKMLFAFMLSLILISGLDGIAIILLSRLLDATNSGSTAETIDSGAAIKIAVIVGLFMLRSLLSTISTWFSLMEFAKQETEIGQLRFRELRKSPMSRRLEMNESDYFTFVDRGPSALINGFLVSVVTAIAEIISGLVILLVVFTIQPTTALVAFGYFLTLALAQQKVLSKYQRKTGEVIFKSGNLTYELLADYYNVHKLMQVAASNSFEPTLRSERLLLAKARAKQGFFASLPRYFMEAMLAFGFLVIAASTWAIEGAASVGPAVVIFATAGFRLLPIVNRIQGLFLAAIGYMPIAKQSLANQTSTVPIQSEVCNLIPSELNEGAIAIKLENVSFRYDTKSAYVIRNFNFTFAKGMQYAIVGPSGSGKTTLIDMCLGLLDPSEGKISFYADEKELHLGYVPQDTHLISTDLFGNVALEWNPLEVDEAKALDALRMAQLDDLVFHNSRADSVSSNLRNLSGGQRQRLGIARALYRDAKILVLDESTSALDATTEYGVMETVNQMRGKVTTILVAHRLSTVKNSDQIIYIENGMILGSGTFLELQRIVPQFRKQVLLGQLDLDL
jgi:ABC-type multidrug transport system fused ATPase/permease subunit